MCSQWGLHRPDCHTFLPRSMIPNTQLVWGHGFISISQREASLLIGLVVLGLLECLVLLQGLLAYRAGFLTVSQMQSVGIQHGLPFLWHFAMWGDLLLMSPLCAYLVGH